MTVYLLHFSDPIAPGRHTAQHYLGYADDLAPRVNAHLHGAGARRLAHDAADGPDRDLPARAHEGEGEEVVGAEAEAFHGLDQAPDGVAQAHDRGYGPVSYTHLTLPTNREV